MNGNAFSREVSCACAFGALLAWWLRQSLATRGAPEFCSSLENTCVLASSFEQAVKVALLFSIQVLDRSLFFLFIMPEMSTLEE